MMDAEIFGEIIPKRRAGMRGLRNLIGLAVVVALSGPAFGQDALTGEEIARRWCSGCHEVGRAPVRNDAIPSFAAIARLPSTTTLSLRVFLGTPHHRMPDYSLTRQEIADVSAYILSLRDVDTTGRQTGGCRGPLALRPH
jgi:mono/diheme cytochrome c family protein